MQPVATPRRNNLLCALPALDYGRLLPSLEAVDLPPAMVLFEPGAPIEFAYFPTESVVTLSYAIEKRVMAKAWSVGREGMVGISLFLETPNRDSRAQVEAGGLAFRLPAAALMTELRRAGALRRVLLRYLAALLTQCSQLCVCHRHHTLEQRYCNFLLRVFAEQSSKSTLITQRRIGLLLGVRRESITEIACRLQQAGIIDYRRGRITLLERKSLQNRACTCDGIIRRALACVAP